MLVAVEPVLAIEHVILADQQQILDRYQALLRLREEMHGLQQTYQSAPRPNALESERVRILTDPQEIGALSVELPLSAQHEMMSLEPPTSPVRRTRAR